MFRQKKGRMFSHGLPHRVVGFYAPADNVLKSVPLT